MKIQAPTYTQTPNELFDRWLPLLKEVELKVLLVIMRKTFGWHKTKDWISISQLEKLTGCSATHVISAVRTLIEKGLVKKEIHGPIGKQVTYYELIVYDDSNNSYPSQFERGTPDNLRGGTPDNLSGTKETNKKTIQKKQQQKTPSGSSSAAVSSHKNKNYSYNCLKNLDIPEIDKIEITNSYSEDVVINAVAWATHPETKINKSLVQAVKWACKTKPEIPKSQKEVVRKNKEYAMQFDGIRHNNIRVEALNNYVSIVYESSVYSPDPILYTDKKFKEKFENALRKIKFI